MAYTKPYTWSAEDANAFVDENVGASVMKEIYDNVKIPWTEKLAQDCILNHWDKSYDAERYYIYNPVSYLVKHAFLAKNATKTPLDTEMVVFEYLPYFMSHADRRKIAEVVAKTLWTSADDYRAVLDDGIY